MISQLMNHDFIYGAANDTRLELAQVLRDRERRSGVDEGPLRKVTDEDIAEVVFELREALMARTDGTAKDDWICMPRHPLLAIVQTELESAIRMQHPEMIEPDPHAPTERRLADDTEPPPGDGRRAYGPFEVTRPKILSDPRWLWSGVVIAWHHFKKKAPFGGLPNEPVLIDDNARLLLVGDWGSGLDRAQDVARQMRVVIDEGIAAGREQHIIHLGDVYYTGDEREYTEQFLPFWPVRPGEDIGCYTLAGNHDMYRGGHAYYKTCLADPRFARQGGRSVFALLSPSWQFLALDTAYEEGGLYGPQTEWVQNQRALKPSHRTALLTHNQPFSVYENAGAKLRDRLGTILTERPRLDAWFWAHEHRCLVYEPRDNIDFPCCLGHGGIPEYLIAREGTPYPETLRYDYRRKHGTGLEPWNTFGFAVLELHGRQITVRYIDEHGSEHHTEEISA